jgi:dihydroflavonol-4-reductase
MYDVNIGGTQNVVRACLDSGIERLVHTSSIAAIGFAEQGPWADESNIFNWESYNVGYRISKHRAEQEVLQGVKDGLPAVIVNPAIVIGPRDIHFNGGQIVRDIRKKRLFFYVDGGSNIVYVDDVVRGHIAAARQGRIGERYILCGENLPFRDVFRITAEVVGGIVPRVRMPNALVATAAGIAETIGNALNRKPWVTRELVARTGTTYYFSRAKAQRELGYSFIPFREAVRRTYEWYRSNGFLT